MLTKHFVSFSLVIGWSLATVGIAWSQTFWTAGTDNWFNAGNWTLGVPDASSPTTFDAVIANGGTTQLLAPGGSVRRLRVGRFEGPGNLLVDAGSLTVTENLYLNETSAGPASMTVNNGGSVTSPNTVVGYGGNHPATLTIMGGGSVNTAVLNVGQGGSSTGELTVESGGTVPTPTASSAASPPRMAWQPSVVPARSGRIAAYSASPTSDKAL
jgi:hypothetical protein